MKAQSQSKAIVEVYGKVIRKDGTIENKGLIYYNGPWWKRLWLNFLAKRGEIDGS